MKGQGATEYLVLLAVVLIIALVSIALLGFFPGLASDARITQSVSYWRGEARPFAILEHAVLVNGSATIIIQNNDATGTFTMTNFTLGPAYTATSTSFAPGESRTIIFNATAAVGAGAVQGNIYDLPVNISYTSPGGVAGRQYGAKNIVGKYV